MKEGEWLNIYVGEGKYYKLRGDAFGGTPSDGAYRFYWLGNKVMRLLIRRW